MRHLRSAIEAAPPAVTSAADSAALARLEGHALLSAGEPLRAASCYAQSAEIYARRGDRLEEGRTSVGWVYALGLAGRPGEAEHVARRARRVLPRNERILRARLSANLAGAWQLAGQLGRAAVGHREAVIEFLASGRPIEAGISAHDLGVLALMTGDAAESRRQCNRALELFADATGTIYPLYSRTVLAVVALVQGKWDEGLTEISALREAFEARGDARARAWLHRELALAFTSIGAHDAAVPEAEAAYHAFESASLEVDAAHAAFLHGRLLAAEGRTVAAVQRLERARGRFQRVGNHPLVRRVELEMARLYLRRGEPEPARALARGAATYLVRRDPEGDGALARAVQAELHLVSGRPGRALDLARTAYTNAKRYPARFERPALALLVARAHEAKGDRVESVRWARRAVRELERLLLRFGTRHTRILVGGAREPIYGAAIDLVLRAGGPRAERRAVDLLAQARSPNLVEDLLQAQSGVIQPEFRAALVRLRDEILSGTTPAAGEDLRSRGLQEEMARLDRRLAQGPARPPHLIRQALADRTFARWGERLGDRDLLLYDQDAGGSWRAFQVRADLHVRRIELPAVAAALDDSWFALRLVFETASRVPRTRRLEFLARTLEESSAHLACLRAALWDPIPWTHREVVVVPSGELHAVPLEALAPDASWAVSRLPHPALLRRPRRRRQTGALLLSGPEAEMQREARAVGAVLRPYGFTAMEGDRRSSLDAESGPLGVLHVAAHGVFHPIGWLLSGIQLSDGWFGFEQLRRERLDGALVYLASCESGRVGRLPGSDIEGWTTAALAAGASEVVLAGWRIDGEAANAFATRFYERWGAGASASVAAAEARADLRAAFPHPYDWCAFFSVGQR